jgi:hypothetical protein
VIISDELREFAETPARFIPSQPGTSVDKYVDERVCIVQGATWALISGVNTTEGLDDLIAEVRGRVPSDKEPQWNIGPSTRPENAYEELERRGFRVPRDGHPFGFALALTQEPDGPDDVEIHRVESFDDFKSARELGWDAFEEPDDRRAKNRARLAEDFEELTRTGVPVEFFATLDGKPAGVAAALPSERGVFLIGGATAAWARGRGLYRALVRARWDYAVELGTPALVTLALPETSYPILKRLGFVEVCRIQRLEDPGESAAA